MKPECRKCKHFFVTHDPRMPMGCRAYQVKSKQLPSIIVKQANNGTDCLGYEMKPHLKPKTKDLNDPSLW
ncbi:MAG: hypothetical protein CMH26_05775 [Micavibrio sp.]|nr:hypothetical protein [Micavibrio sp.]